MSATERTDVVIAGAGFAGLSAAAALKESGLGVVVLEARDRVGGRVGSRRYRLGERFDTGGQFFCEDMVEVTALARRFGKPFVETYVDGEFIVQPPMSEAEAEATYHGASAIRGRQKALDPDDAAIAGLTVAAWLERQPDSAVAKSAYRSMIQGLWCQALERIPLWHLADNDRRITNKTSELQYFLRDTMHSLAEDLAATLGDAVRLDVPVRLVQHGPDGVRISADGLEVEGKQAIVALPLSRAGRLDYAPVLTPKLATALSVWKGGAVVKLRLPYSQPFWRDAGLSGMVMWRDEHGLFACDSSVDESHASLTVFAGGPLSIDWIKDGKDALIDTVLARLGDALGPQAARPLEAWVEGWIGSEWNDGGYGDLVLDVGARDAEATVLAGQPPLHFASSDIAPSFPGYIEGAIIAGRAAAKRVLQQFGRTA